MADTSTRRSNKVTITIDAEVLLTITQILTIAIKNDTPILTLSQAQRAIAFCDAVINS